MPGSPLTSRTLGWPSPARTTASAKRASSSSRPTIGLLPPRAAIGVAASQGLRSEGRHPMPTPGPYVDRAPHTPSTKEHLMHALTDPTTIHRRRWWTLAIINLSLFAIAMDNTILNVALPTLARELHATGSQLQWIVDGYVLVFAGLLLSAGALGDRFGRRGALSAGLVVFGVGSAAAMLADSAPMLIGARAFMGIGGALIMPATLSILTNVFTDPKERAKAIGLWATVGGSPSPSAQSSAGGCSSTSRGAPCSPSTSPSSPSP